MVRFLRLNRIDVFEKTERFQRVLQCTEVFLAFPDESLGDLLRSKGLLVRPLDSGEVAEGSTVIVNDRPLYEVVYVADRLLGPGGCPWDQEQTHESLKRYLLEEAYEVLDAIDAKDLDRLKEELGDVLLQPVMHAEMKRLTAEFDIDDVARMLVDKLVRRHPHVFGEIKVQDVAEVLRNWDRIKQSEKGQGKESILAGVPQGMASLLRGYEISKRAERVGFEWPSIEAVFDKLREEESELREALASGDQEHVESEIGDLLFTVVNLARWAKVEPEEALRKMLNRFSERFRKMEKSATKPLLDLIPEEWDDLWERAKTTR